MKGRPDFRKILDAVIVISCLICGLSFFLAMIDLVPLTFNGFGVDSVGRLYVARGHHIEVWENGEQVHTIRKGTSRGYQFTVLEDDTLMVASGNSVMIMNLEGTEFLDSWEEEDKKTYDDLAERRVFTAVTGERYRIGRLHGRMVILRGETVVYREPLIACILNKLFAASLPCVIAGVIMEVVRKRREDPDYTTSKFKFDPPSRM